jgi:pimeloyl-ACP methyl ester carboxylesterase
MKSSARDGLDACTPLSGCLDYAGTDVGRTAAQAAPAVGPAPAKRRAQRYIAGCEIEVLPNAGHLTSVDEPNLVGTRSVQFLRPSVMKT